MVFTPDGRVHHVQCPKVNRPAGAASGDGHRTDLVRAKVALHALPSWEPNKILARTSEGSHCRGCDTPISMGQIEYELQFADGLRLCLHHSCYVVWDHERRGGARRGIAGGSAASPWTLLFDDGIARRAAHDAVAFEELLMASAQTMFMAGATRGTAAALREDSQRLRAIPGQSRLRISARAGASRSLASGPGYRWSGVRATA